MVPRSAAARTEIALGRPSAMSVVPSIGSTAISTSAPWPVPTSSPLNSMGASSFSPSPMTTTPRMFTELISLRMASTAAPSPSFFIPRPTQPPDARAAASVTLTNSMARLRSGHSVWRVFICAASYSGWAYAGVTPEYKGMTKRVVLVITTISILALMRTLLPALSTRIGGGGESLPYYPGG